MDKKHKYPDKAKIMWRYCSIGQWNQKDTQISNQEKNFEWRRLEKRNKDLNNRIREHPSNHWKRLTKKYKIHHWLKQRNNVPERNSAGENIWMTTKFKEDIQKIIWEKVIIRKIRNESCDTIHSEKYSFIIIDLAELSDNKLIKAYLD